MLALSSILWCHGFLNPAALKTNIYFACIHVIQLLSFWNTLAFCLEKARFTVRFSHSWHICENNPGILRLFHSRMTSVCIALSTLHVTLLSSTLRVHSAKFTPLYQNWGATIIWSFQCWILFLRLLWMIVIRTLWFHCLLRLYFVEIRLISPSLHFYIHLTYTSLGLLRGWSYLGILVSKLL